MGFPRLPWLLPLAFLALCGPLGVFLAVNTPTGQVPDEYMHVMKADSLLGGELVGHRETTSTPNGPRLQQGVDADTALWNVSAEPSPAQLTASRLAAVEGVRWSRPTFAATGTIAGYFPAFYAAPAAALGLAKAFGAEPFDAFRGARVANLAIYLAIGTAALALARRGHALLFCTLAVPMALHLGASINQDGLTIASSALAAALLTRPSGTVGSVARREAARITAAALILGVVLAKPPYVPLALLLLLPFPGLADRRRWAGRATLVGLVVLCGLGWTWVTVHYVATPVVRPPAEAGPLWPGSRPAIFFGTDMAGQMRVLMKKPVRFLTLPWESIRQDKQMLEEAIGVLAYLNLFLPAWLYALWKIALASSAGAGLVWRCDDAETLPLWQVPIPLLCALAALFAVYLSQYLSWTPVGNRHIEGPQGRYWLPLLPAVALAMPRVPGLRRMPRLGAALTAVPLAAGLADVFALPGIIIQFFYVH